LLRSALERGIEVVSEASRHLDSDLKAQHDLRWDDIAGIGNILRHEYQRVDGTIIWRAVKNDLPDLKAASGVFSSPCPEYTPRKLISENKIRGPRPNQSRTRARVWQIP
jgi:hypothetical protein